MNPTEFSRLIDTLGKLTESLNDVTTREKAKKDNAFLDVDDRKEKRQAERDVELTEYLKVAADDTKARAKEKKSLRKMRRKTSTYRQIYFPSTVEWLSTPFLSILE